jgi:uncharacterized protein (UPF0371 family)
MVKMSVCIEEDDYVEAAERTRQALIREHFNGNEKQFSSRIEDAVNAAIDLFMMELGITILD